MYFKKAPTCIFCYIYLGTNGQMLPKIKTALAFDALRRQSQIKKTNLNFSLMLICGALLNLVLFV